MVYFAGITQPLISVSSKGLSKLLPEATSVLKWSLFRRIQKLSAGAWTIKGLVPIQRKIVKIIDCTSGKNKDNSYGFHIIPLISTHLLSKLLQTSTKSLFWFSVFLRPELKLRRKTKSFIGQFLVFQIKLFSRFFTTKLSSGIPNSANA